MFDFPNAPTSGQTVTTPGGSYLWDGLKWKPVPGAGGGGGVTPPAPGTYVTTVNGRLGDVVLNSTDVSTATGLLRTGGTMTGDLILNAMPTKNLQAATKSYVDAMVDLSSPPPIGDSHPNVIYTTRLLNQTASPGQTYTGLFSGEYWSGGSSQLTDKSSGGDFVGSISGTTLTVSSISAGTNIGINGTLMGSGVINGTYVQSQLSGFPPNGVGTYQVSPSQTVSSRAMSCWFYSTAWNGHAISQKPGGTGFGLFSWNKLQQTSGGVFNEFDADNSGGVDCPNIFPPPQYFGTPYTVAVGLQLVANGTNHSTVGLQIANNAPVTAGKFQRGIYLFPGSCNSHGIYVDATSTDTMASSGYFKGPASGITIAAQVKGTPVAGNAQLRLTNDANTLVAAIFQDGSYQGSNVLPTADNFGTVGSSGRRYVQVWATTGTIQTSDPSLKADIKPLPSMLGVVRAVDPVSFRWLESHKETRPVQREVEVQETRQSCPQGHLQYEYLTNPDGSPRMRTEVEHDFEYVSIPGKRTHFGFKAPDIRDAMDKLGIDFAGYVKSEDGLHNLRPDQLIPILWRAVQELTAKLEGDE